VTGEARHHTQSGMIGCCDVHYPSIVSRAAYAGIGSGVRHNSDGVASGMMIIMTVQTVPWLAEKAPTSLIGAAGEHYCMMQLLLRGCLAALTPRGAPDADILVQSLDGAVTAEMQVKARSGRSGKGWRMSEKHEHIVRDRLFYCFVDFGHEASWPVYVIPSKDVAEYLRQSHAAWLAAPGKQGQQRKDWPGRFISPDHPAKGFPGPWMEVYREKWDLIIPQVAL
jgi:hypothetical protein